MKNGERFGSERSRQLRCPKVSKEASEKPFGAPADAYPLSRTGIDAPTTAREWGCRPEGVGRMKSS